MKRLLITSFMIFFVFISSSDLLAQTTSASSDAKIINERETGKFDRKSITLVSLSVNQYSKYQKEMEFGLNSMEMDRRYDNNFINEKFIGKGLEIFRKGNFNFNNIQSDENITLLRDVLIKSGILKSILQSTSNIDTIVERVKRAKKRIVTSATEQAKIAMPTVADVMKYINNTYIGLPVLKEVKQDGESYNSTGALVWLKLDLSNVKTWEGTTPKIDEVNLQFVESKNVSVSNSGVDFNLFSNTNDSKTPKDIQSARNFAQNIIVMSRNMEEFKIRATIQDVEDGIRVDIGNREGVYLDQGYKVFELRQNNSGKIYSDYRGFIRIDKVADNTVKFDAMSNAYTIIPGGFEAGHILVSHDQLFDFVIKGQYKTLFIPKEFGTNLFAVQKTLLFKDDVTATYNVEAGLMFNVARIFNANQLFIGLTGSVGLPNTTNFDQDTSLNISTPLTFEGSLVIQKKFWAPYVAFTLQAELGAKTLSLSGKYKTSTGEKDWEFNTGWNLMAGASAGLEIATSADLTIGLEAGYNYVLSPTELSYKYDGKTTTYKKDDVTKIWNSNKMDDFVLGGLKFGLKVSYSIPSL